MFDSPIVQVLIGLFLVFFVFGTLCSGLAELVNRWLRLRADYLLRGIRSLLDGSGEKQLEELATVGAIGTLSDKLLKLPLVGTLGQETDGNPVDKKHSPSYLPARTFAAGMMDLLIQDEQGRATIAEVATAIQGLPEPARSSLLSLVKTADGSVTRFRVNVENWYDDQMDRVAGWYKRHIRRFIIVFAVLLAVLFNINVITLARTLYTDPASRQALVAEAEALQQCPANQRDQCTEQAKNTVIQLGKSSLPLFWQPTDAGCAARDSDTDQGNDCSFLEKRNMDGAGLLLALIGWAIAAGAISMGGPFWFDLMGKLSSLRSAGNPPPKSSETAAGTA